MKKRSYFNKIRCQFKIVEYLVGIGADVNAASKLGTTALIEANRSGYLELVRYLVEHGAV